MNKEQKVNLTYYEQYELKKIEKENFNKMYKDQIRENEAYLNSLNYKAKQLEDETRFLVTKAYLEILNKQFSAGEIELKINEFTNDEQSITFRKVVKTNK